jgi:hypothetical protein
MNVQYQSISLPWPTPLTTNSLCDFFPLLANAGRPRPVLPMYDVDYSSSSYCTTYVVQSLYYYCCTVINLLTSSSSSHIRATNITTKTGSDKVPHPHCTLRAIFRPFTMDPGGCAIELVERVVVAAEIRHYTTHSVSVCYFVCNKTIRFR